VRFLIDYKIILAKFNLEKAILIFLFSCIAIWLGVLVWASNKGFNISDEGFYMYYFSMTENVKANINITSFHVLQNFLFPFVKPTLQNLRLERLFSGVFSALLLTLASVKFIQTQFNINFLLPKKLLLGGLLFSSFSATYLFAPQTLSYNSFSYLLLSFALVLFLLDFTKKLQIKHVIFYSFLMGIVVSMLLLVKISNAFILYAISLLVFLINDFLNLNNFKKIVLNFLIRISFISIGMLIFQLIVWKGIGGVLTFFGGTQKALSFLPNHGIDDLLNRYIDGVPYLWEILLFNHHIYLLYSCIAIVIFLDKKYKIMLWLALLVQLYIVIHYNIYVGGGSYIPLQTVLYVVWMASFFIVIILKRKIFVGIRKTQIKQLLYLFFLFFFPLIGIIGTDNFPHVQLVFYLSPWFILFFVVLNKYNRPIFTNVFFTLMTIFALYQSYTAVVENPYLLSGSLTDQNTLIHFKNNDEVFIDSKLSIELSEVKSLLINNGFKKGDYIFTYSEMVGLSYVLDANYPSKTTCWFRSGADDTNCKVLTDFFNTNKHVNLFFILDERASFSDEFKACLFNLDFNINEDYDQSKRINVHFNNEDYNISILSPKTLK
tara:strand:+ start:3109 stop:4917 length:1809 start_codon:yes stop_codon:yes gene_type:complete